MSSLDELKEKVSAILQGDFYIDPARDLSAPDTPQDLHFKTLSDWQELKADNPDVPLPLMLRNPKPEQVRYGGIPDKDMAANSYILNVETGQHYQLKGAGGGHYSFEAVGDDVIAHAREHAPKGTKLLLMTPGEDFAINDAGGNQDVYRLEIDGAGQAKVTHWRDVEPKYYDPDQMRVFVPTFSVEAENGASEQSYVLMHKEGDGFVAMPWEEYELFAEQYPALRGLQANITTGDPLTKAEVDRLGEVGVSMPGAGEKPVADVETAPAWDAVPLPDLGR